MSSSTQPSASAPAEPDVSARARRLRRVAAGRMAGLRLVLDRLEDSGNRAAVLRSCEAFGLLHVHEIVGLRPSQQPRVAQKVAAAAKHGGNRRMRRGVGNGGEKWLCVHRHETWGGGAKKNTRKPEPCRVCARPLGICLRVSLSACTPG